MRRLPYTRQMCQYTGMVPAGLFPCFLLCSGLVFGARDFHRLMIGFKRSSQKKKKKKKQKQQHDINNSVDESKAKVNGRPWQAPDADDDDGDDPRAELEEVVSGARDDIDLDIVPRIDESIVPRKLLSADSLCNDEEPRVSFDEGGGRHKRSEGGPGEVERGVGCVSLDAQDTGSATLMPELNAPLPLPAMIKAPERRLSSSAEVRYPQTLNYEP